MTRSGLQITVLAGGSRLTSTHGLDDGLADQLAKLLQDHAGERLRDVLKLPIEG